MILESNYSQKGDLTELRQDMMSSLTATVNAWTIQFQNIETDISKVGNDLQEVRAVLEQWYTFTPDYFEIGRSDSLMRTRYRNDRIEFVYDGQIVSYWEGNMFKVENAEILTSLLIGKFGYYPRSNNNLDFKKSGG